MYIFNVDNYVDESTKSTDWRKLLNLDSLVLESTDCVV